MADNPDELESNENPSAFTPAPRPVVAPMAGSRGNRAPVGTNYRAHGGFMSTAALDAEDAQAANIQQRQARSDAAFDTKAAAAQLEDQMIRKGIDYYKGEDGALRPKRDDAGAVLYKEGDWEKAQQSDGSWAYQRRSKKGTPETKRAPITSKDATDPHLYYDFGTAGREVAGHVDDLVGSKDPETALAATKHRTQWAAAQRKAGMKPLTDQLLSLEQERDAANVQIGDLASQQAGIGAKRAEVQAKAEELKAAGNWKAGWLSGGELTTEAQGIQAQLDKLDAENSALSQKMTDLTSPWEKIGDAVGPKLTQLNAVKAERDAWEAESKLADYTDLAEERRAVLKKLGRSEKDDPILKEISKVQATFGARTAEAKAEAEEAKKARENPFNATLGEVETPFIVGSPDERAKAERDARAAALANRPSLEQRTSHVATQAAKMGDAELLATLDYLAKESAAASQASSTYEGNSTSLKTRLADQSADADAYLGAIKAEREKRGLPETNYELMHRKGALSKIAGAIKGIASGALEGVNQIGASGASALATVLDAAGFDDAAKTVDSFSEAYREVGQEWGARNFSTNDLDSWWNFAAYMGNQSGQLVPQMAVGAGAARLSAALLTGSMNIAQVANAVRGINLAAQSGNRVASAALKAWQLGEGASFPGLLGSSATQEIGQIRQMQLEHARERFAQDTAAGTAHGSVADYEAKFTNPYATLGLGLIAGLGDAGAQSVVLKRLGINIGGEGAEGSKALFKLFDAAEGDKLVPRMMKALAAYNVAELPTELAQTMIERLGVKVADPDSDYFSADLWNDLRETGLAVSAGGLLLGGFGGIRRAETESERQMRDTLQKNSATMFDAWVRGPENVKALSAAMMEPAVRDLLPARAALESAKAFRDNPNDYRNAFALQIVTDHVRATAEAAKQIAAVPDFVLQPDPANPDVLPTPQEASAVKNAGRDAAAALVRLGNGIAPGLLTQGQQAGLQTIGATLGTSMVDVVNGVPVVTDAARNWLFDQVPAAKAMLMSSEGEMRTALAAAAPEENAAAQPSGEQVPTQSDATVADQTSARPQSGFAMKLTPEDVAGPVAPARMLRALARGILRGAAPKLDQIAMARQTAARVNRLAKAFGPVFSGVQVHDESAGSGGFTATGDGNLHVWLGDLADAGNAEALTSDERLGTLFTEEAAHVVSLKLEAEGKWNAADAWAKLSPEEQATFSQAYQRDEQGKPKAESAADGEMARRLAHETVRMFMQGRASLSQDGKLIVDGKTTEQTASRGLIEMLKDIFSKIQQLITGGEGSTGAVEMRAVADRIGGILEQLIGAETFAYGDTRNNSAAGGPVAVNTQEPAGGAGSAPNQVSGENSAQAETETGQAPASNLVGEKIDGEWTAFSPESQTIGIPRAQMPQIKAEARGGLTQFLLARGIEHTQEEVLPTTLKPTQAEFAPAKVAKAREFAGGDRAILVSADNHVVDGHHQWMAKVMDRATEPMRVIRLNAPVRALLDVIPAMPTAETSGGATESADKVDLVLGAAKVAETGPRAAMQVAGDKLTDESRNALAVELGVSPAQIGEVESVTHKGRVFHAVNLVASAEAFPTSHNFDGTVRGEYPQDLQPRDRSGEVYLAQQRQMAAKPNLNEEALKGTTDRGVPIVAIVEGKPVVIMGNGRANAKALMYQSADLASVAQQFSADVAKVAASKGIAAEAVGAVVKPTLYRVALDAMPVESLREASKESNEFAGAATNAVEQARQDAGRMSSAVLSFLAPGFDLTAGRNQPFRQEFVRSVIGSTAANITEGDLVRRIESALFAKAYSGSAEGAAAFSRLLNEEDAGVRGLIGAMMDVAPKIVALNTSIADGSLHPLRISDDVARAVEDIAVTLRDKPSSQTTQVALDGLLNQQEMAGITERTALQDAILRFFVQNRGSKAKIAQALETYTQLARAEGDPKQASMFGDIEVRTPEQIWKDAVSLSGDQALASARSRIAGRINAGISLASGRAGSNTADFFGALGLGDEVKSYAAALPAEVKASPAATVKQAAKEIPAIAGNLAAAKEIARAASPELFQIVADEGQDAPETLAADGQASPEGQRSDFEDDGDAVPVAEDEASVVADVEPMDQDEVRAHEAKFGEDAMLEPEQLFEKYRPAAERMAAIRFSNTPGATRSELMQQARLVLWEVVSGISAQTQQGGNKKWADYLGVSGKNGTPRTFWQHAGNLLRRRLATMFTTNVRQVSRELSIDAGKVGIEGETGGGNFSTDDDNGGGGTIGDYMESGDDVTKDVVRSESIAKARDVVRSAMAILGQREVKALQAAMNTDGYGDLLKNIMAATGVKSPQHANIVLKDAQRKLKEILDGRGFKMSDLSLASGRADYPAVPDAKERAANPPKWRTEANAWSRQVPDVVAFRSLADPRKALFTSRNSREGEGAWRVTWIANPGTEQMRPTSHLDFAEREQAFQYALAMGTPDLGMLFSTPANLSTPEGRSLWEAQLGALMSDAEINSTIGDQKDIDSAFAELRQKQPSGLDEVRANQAFETDGNRVQGRPDLANPGGADETARNAWHAVDEARKPDAKVESREEARAEAERMIASDRPGVLRALLDKAKAGEAFGSTVENYASLILANELVQKGAAGDAVAMEQAAILQNAHRESRSNVARILGAGADVFKKPADRLRDFLSGAIFTPNPEVRKKLEGVWKASEKAREIDRLKGEIAKLSTKTVGQPFTEASKSEDGKQLARLRKQLGEAMDRASRESEELRAIKERIKKVEKAMPGVTLDHIINSEAYFRLIGDNFMKNAVDAMSASAMDKRVIKLMRGGHSDAAIAKRTGLTAQAVADVIARIDAETTKRLESLGDEALDVDKFEFNDKNGGLLSGKAGTLSPEERARRIAIIKERMGIMSDAQRKIRTQKGEAKKRRAPNSQPVERTASDAKPGTVEAPATNGPKGTFENDAADARKQPPAAPDMPADATGKIPAEGGDKQLALGEDADAMPPLFDGTNPHEVAAISRAIQASDGNWFDMAFEAWINGILSGPMTQAANIVGNGFNAGWELSVKRLGEAIVNTVVKDPTAPRLGEFRWMMLGLQPTFAKAWGDALVSFDTEVSNFSTEALDMQVVIPEVDDKTGGVKVSIPGKTGRVVRIPGRLLMAADVFFKSAIAGIHVAAEASRAGMAQGLKGPELAKFVEKESQSGSASWGKAALLARELTFQDDHKGTAMGRVLENITNLRETDIGAGIKPFRFIAPFIRTPFNIFQQGLRQSPAGALMLAARLGTAGLYSIKDGKPVAKSYPTPELIKHSVEQLMAWSLMALLYGAAAGDDDDADKRVLITGSMTDKRSGVNQLNQRAGLGAYTLRIGDVQIKYSRIEPLATMLGTGIDMLTSLKGGNGAFDSFGNFMASAGAAADEKTFLRGWTDLSNALSGETKLKGYVAQQVATAVPNLLKQPIRNLDPVVRQSGTGFFDTLASSVYSPAANPRIDVYGKEIEKPGSAVARLAIPAEIRSTPDLSRVDKLLLNWNSRLTPEERARDGWAPKAPARKFKVDGKPVELDADTYEKYSRRTGEIASRLLAQASLNVSKPTESDIRKVKTAFEMARVQARREVVGAGAVDG